MLTYLRYALATFCFAASVGCLALWGWSAKHNDVIQRAFYNSRFGSLTLQAYQGIGFISFSSSGGGGPSRLSMTFDSLERLDYRYTGVFVGLDRRVKLFSTFHATDRGIHCPLWYSALIFAIAGVAALRLGRFTLRSAIIATTVVAGLLGMAVAL